MLYISIVTVLALECKKLYIKFSSKCKIAVLHCILSSVSNCVCIVSSVKSCDCK